MFFEVSTSRKHLRVVQEDERGRAKEFGMGRDSNLEGSCTGYDCCVHIQMNFSQKYPL